MCHSITIVIAFGAWSELLGLGDPFEDICLIPAHFGFRDSYIGNCPNPQENSLCGPGDLTRGREDVKR